MKTRLSTHFISLLGNIITVGACIFQVVQIPRADKDPRRGWQLARGTDHYRSLYTKVHPTDPYRKCVCGRELDYENMWLVTLLITSPKSNKTSKCIGTVIAHNLVVTSHKCLVEKGKHIRPYEAWQPPPKNKVASMPSPADVVVLARDTFLVDVKNITYNLGYSIDAGGNVASGSDIALVVVDVDLFTIIDVYRNGIILKENFRLPVCIPVKDSSSSLESIRHRYGYYYGIGLNVPDQATPSVLFANELAIMSGKECDDELNLGHFSKFGSLCTRTVIPLPKEEGGPLLTTNVNGYFVVPSEDAEGNTEPLYPQTAFLLGVSTVAVKRPAGKRIAYTYFSNVVENLDFIESVAEEHGSLWCETPKFVQTKKARKEKELKVENWPWESATIKPRSEKVDCACGLKNSPSGGRIAGGEDAIPYEFGWMVLFHVSFDFEDGVAQCGASIINDRMLMTAAHCVVHSAPPYPQIDAHDAFIGVHLSDGNNDKHAAIIKAKEIIVHPGYIPNLKRQFISYDMALLILEKPLKFATGTTAGQVNTHDIRPVCLPKIGQKIELKNGTELTAMGWGILNPWDDETNITFPDVLQKQPVKVGDINDCVHKIGRAIPDTVFCAMYYKKRYGVTQGDSGGPLVFQKPSGQYFQVGMVSYGTDFPPVEPEDLLAEEWLDFLVDIQQFLPFIEYYADLYGAKWCKK